MTKNEIDLKTRLHEFIKERTEHKKKVRLACKENDYFFLAAEVKGYMRAIDEIVEFLEGIE